MTIQYLDCTTESISYNIMGIATISYTILSNTATPVLYTELDDRGGINFKGVITNYNTQEIPNSEHDADGPWYTTSVTLVALGI